nr:hypothetical protein [Nesterenkonia sp. Act20]
MVVLALVILGPERLPQYARNLARWVRQARDMAEDAKGRFKDETGTDFDDVDWKRYDPRQYDPRRIIREALSDEYSEDFRDARSAVTGTLDSARKATDPRELFRSTKPNGRNGVSGVPPSSAFGTAGSAGSALAAGMAGADSRDGTAPREPEDSARTEALRDAPFDSEAT